MDEIMSMVVEGCKLAKEFEANLPTMASQPSLIARSCDDIIKVFSSVKERLNSVMLDQSPLYQHPQMATMIDPSNLQELLRSSVTQAMELFHQTQGLAERSITPFEMVGGRRDYMEGSSSSSLSRLRGTTGADVLVQVPSMEVSGETSAGRVGGGSTSQRSHRRSENARMERVPAPRYGNVEIPPEDGYTWRKYGQKEILNSRFPRSYYRCTHQKLYNCPAKKQVQRLDDDPYMFEVTYHDEHTCHMSSTAPSVAVVAPPDVTREMTQTTVTMQPSQSTLSTWLSMELGTVGSGSGSSGGGVVGGGSSSGAGPSSSSAIRYDREGEQQYLNVANMADAMFNSGSSSSNSMEFLFSNIEDPK